MRAASWRATAVSLVLAACGGSTGRDDDRGEAGDGASEGGAGGARFDGVAGGVTAGGAGSEAVPTAEQIDAATTRIAGAACARLFACCPADYIAILYDDEVDCRVSYGGSLRIAALVQREAAAAGRVAIHLEVAERCSDTADLCDQSPWSCSTGLFEPLVSLGGSCTFTLECVEGRCDSETRRCAPTLPDGSECVLHEDCTSGYCDFTTCAPSAAENTEPCR